MAHILSLVVSLIIIIIIIDYKISRDTLQRCKKSALYFNKYLYVFGLDTTLLSPLLTNCMIKSINNY